VTRHGWPVSATLAALVAVVATPARANTITLFDVPGFSPVTLTLVSTSGPAPAVLAEDVRGLNGAAVTDSSLLGLELLGNVDPVAPFGNHQLYAIDVEPLSYVPLGDALAIGLDPTSLSISGTRASLWGSGVPLSGPVSDPGLVTLVGRLRFDFDLVSFGPDPVNGDQNLSRWGLAAVEPVPEPSSLLLLGSALVAGWRRRRR
jgi:hypothetical protein